MIMPRYSLRSLFVFTAIFALFMVVVSSASHGAELAVAATAGVTVIVISLLVQAAMFFVLRLIGEARYFRGSDTPPLVPGAKQEATTK
jgi:hypothetical protein